MKLYRYSLRQILFFMIILFDLSKIIFGEQYNIRS